MALEDFGGVATGTVRLDPLLPVLEEILTQKTPAK